jgi:hypothetical protein
MADSNVFYDRLEVSIEQAVAGNRPMIFHIEGTTSGRERRHFGRNPIAIASYLCGKPYQGYKLQAQIEEVIVNCVSTEMAKNLGHVDPDLKDHIAIRKIYMSVLGHAALNILSTGANVISADLKPKTATAVKSILAGKRGSAALDALKGRLTDTLNNLNGLELHPAIKRIIFVPVGAGVSKVVFGSVFKSFLVSYIKKNVTAIIAKATAGGIIKVAAMGPKTGIMRIAASAAGCLAAAPLELLLVPAVGAVGFWEWRRMPRSISRKVVEHLRTAVRNPMPAIAGELALITVGAIGPVACMELGRTLWADPSVKEALLSTLDKLA